VRRIPIRLKLASALALPLAALAAVSVVEVSQTAGEVREVRRQTDLARSTIGPSGLISSLQNERTWPAVELIGSEDQIGAMVTGYDETRRRTDEAIEAFRDELGSADDLVAGAFEPALGGLDALEDLRADIDAFAGPRRPEAASVAFAGEIFDGYTELINPFFDATTRVTLEVDADTDLRQGTELADASARALELLALMLRQTITLGLLTEGGLDQPAEIAEVSTLQVEYEDHVETLLSASGRWAAIADEAFPRELHDAVTTEVDRALASSHVDLPTMLGAVNAPRDEGYLPYQEAIHAEINSRADALNDAAEARRIWYAVLALGVVLTAATLTWLVSRSITRPLRSLTRQARDMAEEGLPGAVLEILDTPLGDDVTVPEIAPVAVTTRDEVADVAEALNTVQSSALDLAVEQAVLRRNIADSFLSLGRRNQNLLSRQLDFITELEAHEADPGTLASLFRLDHLATRMRRNAESLLVLAGVEPARRWAAPVAIVDVLRAALGEVESYQRTSVRDVQPALVTGAVATDLAHLVAELLENAITFSPPEESIDVQGRWDREGSYTLAIVDSGFGMSPSELAQANRRLEGAESFTVAPSKYLGHYVAGNLAARHGIRLHLQGSPGHGVTATVQLPPGLLAGAPIDSSGAPAVVPAAAWASGPGGPPPIVVTAVRAGAGAGSGTAGPSPAALGAGAGQAPALGAAAGSVAAFGSDPGSNRSAALDSGPVAAGALGPGDGPFAGRPPTAPAGAAPWSRPPDTDPGSGPRLGTGSPARVAQTGALGGAPGSGPLGIPRQSGPTTPAGQVSRVTGTGAGPLRGGPAAGGPGFAGTMPPADSLWSHLADLVPARPATPLDVGSSDPGAAGHTANGLARRVRGAQLPATAPAPIHRGDAASRSTSAVERGAAVLGGASGPLGDATGSWNASPARPVGDRTGAAGGGTAWASGPADRRSPGTAWASDPAGGRSPAGASGGGAPGGAASAHLAAGAAGGRSSGPGGPAGPGRPDAGWPTRMSPDSAAGDVYGFLSRFTAGVQRGLDESRRPHGGRQ